MAQLQRWRVAVVTIDGGRAGDTTALDAERDYGIREATKQVMNETFNENEAGFSCRVQVTDFSTEEDMQKAGGVFEAATAIMYDKDRYYKNVYIFDEEWLRKIELENDHPDMEEDEVELLMSSANNDQKALDLMFSKRN